MRSAVGLGLVLALMALGASCGDDGARGSVVERLRECHLMSDGTVRHPPFYAPTDCYESCLAGASCEELEAALCSTSVDLLRACDEQCAYHCPDGTLIAVEAACNGTDDCVDGADEEGCDVMAPLCPGGVRCDGYASCNRGIDEANCPDAIACDGRWLGSGSRCNGSPECTTGADEDGCPLCETPGYTYPLPPSTFCDGYMQCPDGSDEAGCATITAMCPMP